tara:strand:- start:1680 stop:2228 length:549 start_codon:yes stop_codon:yes gene_type:complete
MSIQIYKPNKSNTGFGFSFSMGIDKKSQEPVLFVNGIAQYSWNNGVGTFHQNSENPDKTISVKFNEFECGAIIACMKGRYEWSTFHQNKENKTTIKFTPWDKSVKIQKFNPSKKTYDESTQVIPAFGMTITKNGNQTFKLSLEPGECECISSFLKVLLSKLYNKRISKIPQKQTEEIDPFDD